MRRGGLGTVLPSASNEKPKYSTSVEHLRVEHLRVEARALRSGKNAAPSSNERATCTLSYIDSLPTA